MQMRSFVKSRGLIETFKMAVITKRRRERERERERHEGRLPASDPRSLGEKEKES